MNVLRRLKAEEVAQITLALEEQSARFSRGNPAKFGETARRFKALADRFNEAPFLWHGTAEDGDNT